MARCSVRISVLEHSMQEVKDLIARQEGQLQELVCSIRKKEEEKNRQKKIDMVSSHVDLKIYNKDLVYKILAQIITTNPRVKFADVGGLDHVKSKVRESLILPKKFPNLFKGIRASTAHMMLYGPPGTGKTMIAKCVASELNVMFLNVSIASLTSKWHSESENLVRLLFVIARLLTPCVIFIDEIDSLGRIKGSCDASSSMLTELLIQLDGFEDNTGVYVIAATNRPNAIDLAVLRRFELCYVGLPDARTREAIITNIKNSDEGKIEYNLQLNDIAKLSAMLDGYSGSDIFKVMKEASMQPVRQVLCDVSDDTTEVAARAVTLADFEEAVLTVKPSVTKKDVEFYVHYNKLHQQ